MNEELKIYITAQIDDLKKALKDAQNETKKTADKGSSHMKKFGNAAKAAGKTIASGMKVAIGAIAAAAAALVGLAESTREYRTEQAKLVSAFESAGASAEQAKETYNDLYRVLGDSGQATEAANHLAKLTTNEQELAEWTNICQGVYATFGDSLPIEGLTEAANETAKVGTITGSLADALNWAGVSEDEFNAKLAACNDEAEREALIRETLIGIYDEASAAYEKNAEDILAANDAQRVLTDGLAALGEAAEPLVSLFKEGLGGALQELAPHIQAISQGLQDVVNGVDGGAERLAESISNMLLGLVDKIDTILPELIKVGIELIKALIAGISQALPDILNAIVEACLMIVDALPELIDLILTAVIDNLPMIFEAITAIILAIVDALPELILMIVHKLPDLITAIIDGLMACLPQLIAGLVQLVLELVIALPEILMALVEAIFALFGSLWDGIMDIFSGVGDFFGDIFSAAFEAIKNAFSAVIDFFAGIWDGICEAFSAVANWFGDMFSKAWEAVKKVWDKVVGFFKGVWDGIVEIFSAIGTAVSDALTGAVRAAINAVLTGAIGIINGFIAAINGVIWVINLIPGVDLGSIGYLEVPQLASGGVVDEATLAVIGEQGKEAVVPLENNTEWIDMMANRLSDSMGFGNTGPIILQVDGKTFGQISVDSINQLTRQRGQIPLTIW